MRILLTNDDGIHAPGLVALEAIARALSDDVVVIAPETDQSGVSHSLSLSDPLRVRHIGEGRYAVRGTPTDCVLMGVQHILKDKKPDLVLSGVNRGQNIAEDVTYSGTIAGAMEGTLLGIPSVALSQGYGFGSDNRKPRWRCAETHAPGIIRKLLAHGFAKGVLFNVNFPDCEPEEVVGISTTIQGRRDVAALMDVVEREDYRGNLYYWLAPRRERPTPLEGTDLWAMYQKRISVTPLKLDLTDVAALERLAEVFDGIK
ncbi:5'/3'-nucleotidase SurE [Labrys wisconsinensis]|uniref:5'-nucleotidase SurE n=1 Tax=Labrys wisconsinensis TaxID=425677 RepID=A0ABU0J3C8_9HYPH|nr:5'/3'-nucleotidase SurE [Labrys wisconsinensis]MDQ0468774.1 5'-nucleotidase [Labrys wisconsinensis]